MFDSRLIQCMSERVLIWDGALGTQYQAANLPNEAFILTPEMFTSDTGKRTANNLNGEFLEGCNEVLNFTRPDVIYDIHRSYLDIGSDMIETNTFGANPAALKEYEIGDLLVDVCAKAGEVAVQAARDASTPDKPRFAIGALGPGTKLITLGQIDWNTLVSGYQAAFEALIRTGVDGLLLETLQDLLMVKAGIVAARGAMESTGKRLPLIVQVTMEQTGTMLVGSEMGAVISMCECFPEIVAIGMNCATGPAEMTEHIRFLSENSTRPSSIQPNAGLPIMEKGHAVYKLTPSELAEYHAQFITEFGVSLVGGCCGTTPDHLKAVSERIAGLTPAKNAYWQQVRQTFPGFDFEINTPQRSEAIKLKGASSLYQFVPYEQDLSFLIIGERTNANGSKAFRDMLAAENWGGLTELARELEGEGSHMIDVCTAYVGRDEVADMTTLLKKYNQHITVPIMIDSTEANVVEAALQTLAGKPLINSINFEDGEERTEKILAMCRKYGAAVVGLTIDETGMAKSVEHKIAVADRILERTRAAGLPDHDVFIDCLTFTLGSGDEEFRKSGEATIDAIRLLKEKYPSVNTVLGVSNVSFGLKAAARQILNSVFLHYCREAGLTSAIVHFSKIVPQNRIDEDIWQVASDLVYDRRKFSEAG